MTRFAHWMTEFARPDRVWYAKRLSGNDTAANGTHQAGPYIPRDFLNSRFPSLNRPEVLNPNVWFELFVDSHSVHQTVRAVWYNNSLHDGTRNESRLTNFGGISSPLLDPENTGALVIFAFRRVEEGDAPDCRVWICRDEKEEESAEDLIGPVEPAQTVIWSPERGRMSEPARGPVRCWLEPSEIPYDWIESFPSGKEILKKAVELSPQHIELNPDARLLARRDCEYQVFRSIEEAVELPGIREGFDNIDQFVARAQSVLQRRKVRSGRSLELQVRQIFREEELTEGRHFSHGVDSEPGSKPDFLFPSQTSYRNPGFPESKLRMLAVKTTCKDRWRQVLKEADRIPIKHLLTLQEGVSVNQYRQMTESRVRLVVPEGHVTRFPREIRKGLTTFRGFIQDVKSLRETTPA